MRSVTLLLLAALLPLAGCLDDSPPDEAPTDDSGEEAAPPETSAEPPAPCDDYENYGVFVGTGTHYTATGPDGDQRVYEESNGKGGLQIEEDCPENPDTRIA